MTYLGSLLAQAGGVSTPLRPLLPARFEPAAPAEAVAEHLGPAPALQGQPVPAVSTAPRIEPPATQAPRPARAERPRPASRAELAEGVVPSRAASRPSDRSASHDETPRVARRSNDRVERAPTARVQRAAVPSPGGAVLRRGDPAATDPRPAATLAAPPDPPTATPPTASTPPTVVMARPGPALRPEPGSPVRRRGREDRDAAPTIRVSIGRVELRTPPAVRPTAAPAPRLPRLSLDDYLRDRSR